MKHTLEKWQKEISCFVEKENQFFPDILVYSVAFPLNTNLMSVSINRQVSFLIGLRDGAASLIALQDKVMGEMPVLK